MKNALYKSEYTIFVLGILHNDMMQTLRLYNMYKTSLRITFYNTTISNDHFRIYKTRNKYNVLSLEYILQKTPFFIYVFLFIGI